jgi:hypothetical protein
MRPFLSVIPDMSAGGQWHAVAMECDESPELQTLHTAMADLSRRIASAAPADREQLFAEAKSLTDQMIDYMNRRHPGVHWEPWGG